MAIWWPKLRDSAIATMLGSRRGRLGQHLERPIRAAVVDEHHLVRPARDVVQHPTQTGEQLGQHLLLVEHRDRDRQARRRRHDRGRPLKYTMCHNGIPNPLS